MSFDADDICKPPYAFGECNSLTTIITARCECFENEYTNARAYVKKVGDWVTVHIPNIIEKASNAARVDMGKIVIEPFLPADYLGDTPRKRFFGGFAKVFDLETGVPKITLSVITLDTDGTITINPATKNVTVLSKGGVKNVTTSNWFYTDTTKNDSIGSLVVDFTYVVDDGHYLNSDLKFTKLSTN